MEGGETFVPKIPSMKMTDVARVMAPHLSHQIIGLRPGEKLHEIMVAADDAQHTYDFQDRFVILPSIKFYDREYGYLKAAKAVDGYFTYASNTNEEWLSDEHFTDLVENYSPETS